MIEEFQLITQPPRKQPARLESLEAYRLALQRQRAARRKSWHSRLSYVFVVMGVLGLAILGGSVIGVGLVELFDLVCRS